MPQAINELFTLNKNIHDHNTRSREGIHANPINTRTFGSRKNSYQSRQYWDKLPQAIKSEVSLNVFKKKLKEHIISTYD